MVKLQIEAKEFIELVACKTELELMKSNSHTGYIVYER